MTHEELIKAQEALFAKSRERMAGQLALQAAERQTESSSVVKDEAEASGIV